MLVSRRVSSSDTRFSMSEPLGPIDASPSSYYGEGLFGRGHSTSPGSSIGSPRASCRIVASRPPSYRAIPAQCSASAGGGGPASNGSTPAMVAIDSKIEQAMDLVKTHLMFAVREEVEVLRGRIVDLETTVGNLQAENDVLRQHVSDEIIRNLTLNG